MNLQALNVAVIDDWQGVAQHCADWSPLQRRAEVTFESRPFADDEERVRALAAADIIVPMRERTQFHRQLLERLPRLRMLALTGYGLRHVDAAYCDEHAIICSASGAYAPAGTAEFTLGLLLAAARHIPQADAAMRRGDFQAQMPLGTVLEGSTLGIIGLGRIGARLAAYGRALGMHVIAWSQNLSSERAREAGAEYCSKDELLRQADVITLHLVLSDRTRGIIGAQEFAAMKPGALLINTSRGPLVQEAALIEALRSGRITAGLDVYDQEPLPSQHALRSMPNVVLTPHLGFCTTSAFAQFYGESIENILGFLDGTPLRVVNNPRRY
jgi:phosphoglycerate dehydrogenase-like enzyme